MVLSQNTYLQNGKYRILRVLGQGGFGITYLAEHTFLDRLVAIKEFFPKEYCERDESTSHVTIGMKNSSELVETLKTKFLKEAKNISKLDHPGIVKIFDIFQENGTAYYIMEYVEGESLSSKIKSEGAMSEANAINLLRKTASAISHIHGLSMNHLDIKPANIMIRAKDGEPILIDFGLSKQYDSSGGQTSTTPVGISHGYAPIEQYIPGGVSSFSPQTDIYALGATLFAMLTGKTPPHYGEILENGIPDYPSSVSETTKEAIEHALETKKTKRPSTIDEFLAMLPNNVSSHETNEEVPANQPILNKECEVDDAPTPEHRVTTQPQENLQPKLVEETVVLNVPLSNYTAANKDEQIIDDTPRIVPSSDMQFLDLGLSVKWATKLSGIAKPVMNDDVYTFQMENGDIVRPKDFLSEHNLPTIKQFEELIERCSWTTFSENGMHGYKIIGPNGNILMMPLGVLNRYLSAECLKPNSLYYLSFASI